MQAVRWTGDWVLLVAFAVGIVSAVQERQFKNAWLARVRALAVLRYFDDKLRVSPSYPPNTHSLWHDSELWRAWYESGKLLSALGRHEEARKSRVLAKQAALKSLQGYEGSCNLPKFYSSQLP